MNNKKIVLFDIDYTLFDTDIFKESGLKKHSVYNEVNDVLTKLSRIAILGIFSEGDLEFQENKLLKTGIQKHFDKDYIHIAEKKEEILKKIIQKYINNRVFLVDDKLSILHLAKNISFPLFTIWVKRGMYAINQKEISGFKPDAVVNDLKEIVPLITNS